MTNEERDKTIAQIERIQKHLASVGETVDYLDFAIEALETQTWIPVSEKLPTADEDVLITNGRGMHVGWFDSVAKCWLGDFESEYFTNNIIAWMPLPESYKEEDEE